MTGVQTCALPIYRAYLPSVSFGVLGAALLVRLIRKPVYRNTILAMVVILFCSLTVVRNHTYVNNMGLALDTIFKSPHLPRAYLRLMSAFIKEAEYEKAIKTVETGLRFIPEEDIYARGRLLIGKGSAFIHMRMYEEALVSARQAENVLDDTEREKLKLNHLYGMAYSGLNRFSQAKDYFYKCYLADPANINGFEYQLNYAICLRNMGELEKARKIFHKLLQGYPSKSGIIYLNLGLTHIRMKEEEKGMKFIRRSLGPDNLSPADLRRIGIASLGKGNEREGFLILSLYHEMRPRDPLGCYNIGAYYLENNQLEKAETWLRKSHRLDPLASEPLASLCRLYGKTGNTSAEKEVRMKLESILSKRRNPVE